MTDPGDRRSELAAAASRAHRRDSALASAYRWTIGLALAAAPVGGLLRHRPRAPRALDRASAHAPRRRHPVLALDVLVLPAVLRGHLPDRDRRLPHRRLFNRSPTAVSLVMLIGAMGHLFVGAEYPRPVLYPPYPDLSYAFMAWVQHVDPPGQRVPVAARRPHDDAGAAADRDRPRLGRFALVMATMLALSTLTTKQHFIADVWPATCWRFLGRAFALRRLLRRRLVALLGGAARPQRDRLLEVDPLVGMPVLASCGSMTSALADDHHHQGVGAQQVGGRRLGLRLVDGGQAQRSSRRRRRPARAARRPRARRRCRPPSAG